MLTRNVEAEAEVEAGSAGSATSTSLVLRKAEEKAASILKITSEIGKEEEIGNSMKGIHISSTKEEERRMGGRAGHSGLK